MDVTPDPATYTTRVAKIIETYRHTQSSLNNTHRSNHSHHFEPQYTILQNDSRGIPHILLTNLSDVEARNIRSEAFTTAGEQLSIIRERAHKTSTSRHPARSFLGLAICHSCACLASIHNEFGCTEHDVCKRKRELVILDGITDFIAEGLSFGDALDHPQDFAAILVVESDPSGVGYRLRLEENATPGSRSLASPRS